MPVATPQHTPRAYKARGGPKYRFVRELSPGRIWGCSWLRGHVESLLLLPRGYDLRYCLLTCLLLLRDRNGVGLPPPPNPQAGTAPGDPHCGRKGYAWVAPGFCLSAEIVVTTSPRNPAGSVAPRSPGPCMGRAETGLARRGRGEPSPTQRRLHPSPSGPAWAAEG